jgi:hypothetical protein
MAYRYQKKETALPSTNYTVVLHSTNNVHLFVAHDSRSNQLYETSTGFHNEESLLPRSSLSRDVTQCRLVVSYRHIRTNVPFHLQGPSTTIRITLEEVTDRLSRNVRQLTIKLIVLLSVHCSISV